LRQILSKIARLFGRAPTGVEDPRVVFEHFRRVLRSNNRALEIIADLGEKLSGAYIFDSRYIEASVSSLSETVLASVDALNVLDPHHQELYAVHARLTEHLKTVLLGEEDRQGPRLLALDAIDPAQWAIVGGKVAHLAELIHYLKLAIPPGFAITTRTYHELIDHNSLRSLVDEFEALWVTETSTTGALDEVRGRLAEAILAAEPPPGLLAELTVSLEALAAPAPPGFTLAVRSSAQEEDLDFSFAGQFESVLNVAARPEEVFHAYRVVVASLFGREAVAYRRQIFPDRGRMSIACGCQQMIDSLVSGVAYSTDPGNPGTDSMVVVGAWGQGAGIVEGEIPVDTFQLRKGEPAVVLDRQTSRKESGLYLAEGGGLYERPLKEVRRNRPCLTDPQLQELAQQVIRMENYFKRPQDIEWTFDRSGRLFILQSRPLLVPVTRELRRELPETLQHYELLLADQGQVAQQGIGAGPVHLIGSDADLEDFPDGGVLVARRDSSHFVRVMPRAAAIITEIGSPVSHMATLSREFQVPCLVNVTGILALVANGQEITVDAEDRRIFKGRVRELLAYQLATSVSLGATWEFRLLRRLLNSVARLHLIDPLLDQFVPENCRTYHDLLRYIHETAVITLVNMGKDERSLLRHHLARSLDLPVPAGIIVIDIGGGLSESAPPSQVPFAAVTSIPFRAILQGMLYPGVWHLAGMPVGFHDMMSSMLSVPGEALDGRYSGHNLAVVSHNYVNLCFRFGYHFNIIDAHCDEVERNNHIYFRFLGGATDLTKRSRRARLISEILTAFDFNVRTRGDLVIARAGNMLQSEMERSLDILGRLVGFTRQLDVRLDSEERVDYYVEAFLMGNYEAV
jgi:pyruvate,water dikinase